jgi:hypothetical protein
LADIRLTALDLTDGAYRAFPLVGATPPVNEIQRKIDIVDLAVPSDRKERHTFLVRHRRPAPKERYHPLFKIDISMHSRIDTLIFTAFLASAAFADDTAPTLSLSKAARLAEDAIASASLPSDCYLRSISLTKSADGASCYRAIYKPTGTRNAQSETEPGSVTVEFINVTMDGKVSFEHEKIQPRERVKARSAE